MAIDVTDLYITFKDEHKLSIKLSKEVFGSVHYLRKMEESKTINKMEESVIIIAGLGMEEGNCVLHHLIHIISDERNSILSVGFQVNRTAGRTLIDGSENIWLYGKCIPFVHQ